MKDRGHSDIISRIFPQGGNTPLDGSALADAVRVQSIFGLSDQEADTLSPSYNETRSNILGSFDENPYTGFMQKGFIDSADEAIRSNPDIAKEALNRAFDWEIAESAQSLLVNSTMDSSRAFKSIFSGADVVSNLGLFAGLGRDVEKERQFARDRLAGFGVGFISGTNPSTNQSSATLGWADHALGQIVERDIREARGSSYRLSSSLNEMSESGQGLTIAKRLLLSSEYVARPGIALAASMIQSSSSEINIDIYQLQNKAIQDLLIAKILTSNKDNPLTVNVRTAFIKDEVKDDVALGILGPNALVLRTLKNLSTIGNAIVNVQVGSDRSHSKFMLTEEAALIGSLNLTASVGQSIYQSGSNYEAIRVLNNKLEGVDDVESKSSNFLRMLTREDSSEVLLYRQARDTMRQVFAGGSDMSSGQENIVKGREIWEHLKQTVELGDRDKRVKSVFNLDQVFLLQYEDSMVEKYQKGEFGEFDSATAGIYSGIDPRRMEQYRSVQLKFLKQVIEGRAKVTVDVRNYTDNIQSVLFDRVGALLGNDFSDRFNYDISAVVNNYAGYGSVEDKITNLSFELMSRGLENSAAHSLAVQMLVSTSGNVEMSTASRQHVKEYASYIESESGQIKFLSQMLSSSNLGALSLAITDDPIEEKIASVETGLAFIHPRLGVGRSRKGDNYLNDEQVLRELEKGGRFTMANSDELSGGAFTTGQDRRASWERNIDSRRLMDLYQSMKGMAEDSGVFSVSRNFDKKGKFISFELAVDSSSIAGVAGNRKIYKFTSLKSASGSEDGFIYAVNENKLIGESLFVNESSSDIKDPFKEAEVIAAGTRRKLSAKETLMSLMAGAALDISRTYLVDAPMNYYKDRFSNVDEFKGGVVQYLLSLSGNPKGELEDLLRLNNEELFKLGKRMTDSMLHTTNKKGDRISQLTGLSAEELGSKRAMIQYQVHEMLANFAKSDIEERRRILLGDHSKYVTDGVKQDGFDEYNRAVTDGRDVGIRTFVDLFSYMLDQDSPIFTDFLNDFVTRQGDSAYYSFIKKKVSESFTSMFEVFLTSGQARTYGSTQAKYKLPLFGVNDNRDNWIESLADESSPLKKLFGMALTSSPFEYNPGVTLGKGEGLYIRGVAEGGSSREDIATKNLMSSLFDGRLVSVHKHKKVGDVTDVRIIEDTATGIVITEDRRKQYLVYLESLGIGGDKLEEIRQRMEEESSKFEGDIYTFNFSDASKLHQIPQRLKNVIGTRPLHDLSVEYQELIETGRVQVMKSRLGSTFTNITSVGELREAYMRDIRNSLVVELRRGGITDLETINKFVQRVDDSVISVGALYAGQIKSFLSERMMDQLNRMALEVEQEYGVSTETAVGAELLRARVFHSEQGGSADKSFIGSSRRSGRPDVMLLQMAGAYSDPFFANPNFGVVKDGERVVAEGIRQGYTDRAVKTNKASMFSANMKVTEWDTTIQGMGMSVKKALSIGEGDVVRFDPATNKSWVMTRDEKTGELVKKVSVDQRSQMTLLRGIVESLNGNNPSLAKLEMKSFINTAIGEFGIEVIRDLKILSGSPNTNEIEIEITLDRTRMPGGGSRLSAMGGLFKGVAMFIYGGFFKDIVGHMNGSKLGQVGSFLFGGAAGEDTLKLEQVMGMGSPSNLKSYFFEHGASVITYNQGYIAKEMLKNIDTKVLAFGLLTSFGDDLYGLGDDERNILRKRVGKLAMDGAFGEFYKTLAAKQLFSAKNSISGMGDDLYGLIGEGLIKFSEKNPALRDIQFNALKGINGSDLLDIFSENRIASSEANVIDHLQKIFGAGAEHIDFIGGELRLKNSISGREAATIAGALHIVTQQSLSKVISVPAFDLNDESALLSMAMMTGMTREELLSQRDSEYMKDIIRAVGTRFTPIGLMMQATFSQSQIPLSSRKGSNLEAQHIIPAGFVLQKKAFAQGGTVDSLRRLMANYYGGIAGVAPSSLGEFTKNFEVIDLTSLRGVGGELKSKMLGVYAGYQGETLFKDYRLKYEAYNLAYTLVNSPIEDSDLRKSLNGLFGGSLGKKGFKDVTLEQMLKGGASIDQIRFHLRESLQEVLGHFHAVEKAFALDPDKSLSIDFAEGITRGMKATGSKTFGYSIPKMEFMPDTGKVRIYRDQRIFGVSLGGNDLAALGEQFGDFLSEEQKAMVKIWRGIAPGSAVSRVMSMIHNSDSDLLEGLSLDEIKALEEFQSVTMESVGMINAASVGRRTQQVFGNKIGVDGGVYTAASSFLVPKGINITPEEILNRNSMRVSEERASKLPYLDKIIYESARRIDELGDRTKKYRIYDKAVKDPTGKKLQADLIKAYSAGVTIDPEVLLDYYSERAILYQEAYETRGSHRDTYKFYQAQRALINSGASQTAFYMYKKLEEVTSELKNQIDLANGNLTLLSEVENRVDSLLQGYKKSEIRGDIMGDSFFTELSIRQMYILKADIAERIDPNSISTRQLVERRTKYRSFLMPFESTLDVGADGDYSKVGGRDAYVSKQLETFIGQLRNASHYSEAVNDEKRLMGSTEKQKQEEFMDSIGVPNKQTLSAGLLGQSIDNILSVVREYKTDIIGADPEFFAASRGSGDERDKRLVGSFAARAISFEERLIFLKNIVSKLEAQSNPPEVDGKPGKARNVAERLAAARDKLDALSSEFLVEFYGASNFAGRSAPPGNMQLMFSVFRNGSLAQLDSKLDSLGVGIRFTPEDGLNRNKTLGMQRPIGMLVSMLGDYDGDSVITIMDHTIRHRLELKNVMSNISVIAGAIDQLENNVSILRAKTERTKTEESELKLKSELIQDQKKRLENLKDKESDLSAVVKASDTYFSKIGFNEAARKWVAAYTKVDERFFVSTKEKDSRGRYGWAIDTVSPDVLFTYIEQGKGLFPGLEDIYKDNADSMYRAVREISFEINGRGGPITKEAVADALGTLSSAGNKFAEIFSELNNVREGALDELVEAITVGKEAEFVSDMVNASVQDKAVGKLVTQAFGASIDKDRFDMMSQVLGEAGSVLLGKSYNNLIGTLYSEAPLLSTANTISNVFSNKTSRSAFLEGIARHRYEEGYRSANPIMSGETETEFEARVAAHMEGATKAQVWGSRDNMRSIISLGRSLYESSRAVSYESQQMGGFLQTLNQIMRDSIKLKGDESFLDALGDRLDEYRNASSDEEKNAIIRDIAGSLGEGAGMRALQQLESLNTHYGVLFDKSTQSDERSAILRDDFRLSSEDRSLMASVLGFIPTSISEEEMKVRGYRKFQAGMAQDTSYQDMATAAYKTKMDLVSQVTAFSFSRNVKQGGSDLSNVIEQGISNRADYENQSLFEQLTSQARDIRGILSSSSDKAATINAVSKWAADNGRHAMELASTIIDMGGIADFDDSKINLFVSTYMNAKSQIEGVSGEFGEGLLRMAKFNALRKSSAAGNLQSAINKGWADEKDGMTMAVITAAVTGKFDESSMASMALVLTEAYKGMKGGGPEAKEGEIVYSIMRDMITGSGHGLNHTQAHVDFLGLLTQLGNTEAGKKTLDGLARGARNTFFGQVAKTIGANIKATAKQDPSVSPVYDYLKSSLGLSDDMAKEYANLINKRDPNAEDGRSLEDIVNDAVRANNASSTFVKPVAGKSINISNSKAANIILNKHSDEWATLALLPLLGILGQAVSTGSIDPETTQQVLGNTISSVGYMRDPNATNLGKTNFSRMALTAGAGTSFKMRFALQEHEGDVAKAFTSTALREMSLMAFGRFATPVIAKGVSRLFGYKGPSIDFDKYEGARSVASTIVGAVSAAILGMAVGEATAGFVVPAGQVDNPLSVALKAAFDVDLLARSDIRDESKISVVDEFGDSVEYQATTLSTDTSYLDRVAFEETVVYSGQNPNELQEEFMVA